LGLRERARSSYVNSGIFLLLCVRIFAPIAPSYGDSFTLHTDFHASRILRVRTSCGMNARGLSRRLLACLRRECILNPTSVSYVSYIVRRARSPKRVIFVGPYCNCVVTFGASPDSCALTVLVHETNFRKPRYRTSVF